MQLKDQSSLSKLDFCLPHDPLPAFIYYLQGVNVMLMQNGY